MFQDALRDLWWAVDERQPRLSGTTVSGWPAELRKDFVTAGLISPAEMATSAECEGCPDLPYQVVEFLPDRRGNQQAYVCCSRCGPYKIDPELLQSWRVEWQPFLAAVCRAMEITGPCRELVPDRVWRLGKARWNDTRCVSYFVRAPHRQDTVSVLGQAAVPENAVLMTPLRQPHPEVVQGVVLLELALSWNGASFVADIEYIADLLRPGTPERSHPKPPVKRGSRTALIEQLTQELREHLRSVRDHVLAALDHGLEPKLLPRPTQKDLAKCCGVSTVAVCRCLQDSSAHELQMLWNLSTDLEAVLRSLPGAAG